MKSAKRSGFPDDFDVIANAVDAQLLTLEAADAARVMLRKARENGPVFQPNNVGGDNVLVATNLLKSNRRVLLGSLLHENAARLYEFDDDVLEVHYHFASVDLHVKDSAGIVRSRDPYSPQFLVIRRNQLPVIEDWKLPSSFANVSRNEGARYLENPDGVWHDRAASEWAASMGCTHRIRMQGEISHTFLRNGRFLVDFRTRRNLPLCDERRRKLRAAVSKGPVLFRDLVRLGFTADEIFAGIVERAIIADLETQLLSEVDELLLHGTIVDAQFYREVRAANLEEHPVPLPAVDGVKVGDPVTYLGQLFKVKVITSTDGLIEREGGHAESLPTLRLRKMVEAFMHSNGLAHEIEKRRERCWRDLSTKQRRTALQRLKVIRSNGEGVKKRTYYRWRALYDAAKGALARLVALAPHDPEKGRRTGRFSDPRVDELARECIKKFYNTPDCNTASQTWDKYVGACADEGLAPMSYTAFLKRVNELEDVRARKGKRVAHVATDIPLLFDVHEPLSGVYPHDVIYIDHTLLPLFTNGPHGEEFGKVWASIAVDGCTTRVYGLFLSYCGPSAHTVLMVLRDYVRRHGRFPRVLVVDGGIEFGSREIEELAESFNIDVRFRSSGSPRGGNKVENVYGVTEIEFTAGLEGNSRGMRSGTREMTAAVDPRKRRVWTFTMLSRALENYLMDDRPNNAVHPVLGMTPAEYERKRISETGTRDEDNPIELDEDLMLLTSTFPKQEKHKVHPHIGIWETGAYYWAPELADYENQTLTVRVEPWYAGVIYVNIGKRWVVAWSRSRERWTRTRYELTLAWRRQATEARRAAQRDRRSLERAKARSATLNPKFFEDSVHLQQQIERLYWIDIWKITTARPLPNDVLSAQPENRDAHDAAGTVDPGEHGSSEPTDGVKDGSGDKDIGKTPESSDVVERDLADEEGSKDVDFLDFREADELTGMI
ncbi:transposase family protein [Paraburkholderia fungorum]|uniref:integrase catalytic domain-containing protein n=1 Tax=Paraburkholderia fungorum TaxID=134537 RepID=UPI0038BAA389